MTTTFFLPHCHIDGISHLMVIAICQANLNRLEGLGAPKMSDIIEVHLFTP